MIDQEDIGGLDVAVDDAFGVRGIEAIGDFDAMSQGLGNFDGLSLDAVLESLPFRSSMAMKGRPSNSPIS